MDFELLIVKISEKRFLVFGIKNSSKLKEIIEIIFSLRFFLFSNKAQNKLVIISARSGPFLA
jgi:hypothetical protein